MTFIHEIEDRYDPKGKVKVYPNFFTDRRYKRTWRFISWRAEKKNENLISKIFNTKYGKLIMQSKCAECGIKKSRFVKEQEVKVLLSNLGFKTPLSKILLLNVLF